MGLVVAVAGPFIVDWIREGVAKQGIDGFWTPILRVCLVALAGLALIGLMVLVAISVFRQTLRERTWTRLARLVRDVRPVTSKRLRRDVSAAKVEGYEKHKTEIAEARANAKRPRWRVSAEDRLFGDMGLHWLTNDGYAAHDVRLTADPAEFACDGEVFFRGSFGDARPGASIAKQFRGAPTERGTAEGVTFTVSWFDEDGNAYKTPVFMSPEEIRKGRDSATEEARNEGWREGYAEAKEHYERVAAEAAESDLPAPVPPAPRWHLEESSGVVPLDGGPIELTLSNAIPESVALGVRMDGVTNARVRDAGYWSDMSGAVEKTVAVDLSREGIYEGSTFRLTYTDYSGTERCVTLYLGAFDEYPSHSVSRDADF